LKESVGILWPPFTTILPPSYLASRQKICRGFQLTNKRKKWRSCILTIIG
jgi:hypothetical protein